MPSSSAAWRKMGSCTANCPPPDGMNLLMMPPEIIAHAPSVPQFLILPVTQVPPFDVKRRCVTEIEGVQMETYIDWMKSCYYVTATGLPAISVPCGFTPERLPVGVQIVERHQDDIGVLQLAHAFEKATGFWEIRPPVVE